MEFFKVNKFKEYENNELMEIYTGCNQNMGHLLIPMSLKVYINNSAIPTLIYKLPHINMNTQNGHNGLYFPKSIKKKNSAISFRCPSVCRFVCFLSKIPISNLKNGLRFLMKFSIRYML